MPALPSREPSSMTRSSQSAKLWASTLSTASARKLSSLKKMVITVTAGADKPVILDGVDDGALDPLKEQRSDQEKECYLEHRGDEPDRLDAAGADQNPAQTLDQRCERVDHGEHGAPGLRNRRQRIDDRRREQPELQQKRRGDRKIPVLCRAAGDPQPQGQRQCRHSEK